MEKLHLSDRLYNFDASFGEIVCGIDEAGRGCLAGDVFAAAVILGNKPLQGLDDSKKLSPIKRDKLYDEIIADCVAYAIATASVAEIEDLNILNAALLAMERAYENLKQQSAITKPHTILIDGNVAPKSGIPIEALHTVIGGDAKSASIAAASILAKVARDRYMQELDSDYPEYFFAKHKGYATKLHRETILKHGGSPIHRQSFLKKLLN
ncbi:MAG: ribonuclease HII [Oscillospiraceae bacterium]|nr:ribonuclease HII [Oscillospiraceae bacterium]